MAFLKDRRAIPTTDENLRKEEINWLSISGEEKFEKELREIARREGSAENAFVKENRCPLFEAGERRGDKRIISLEVFKNAFMIVAPQFERKIADL
ncbi:MAG: hypothetical protein WDA18_09410 [Candidatus Ratteibacteria bacterium]|jgi:hypothetical protein